MIGVHDELVVPFAIAASRYVHVGAVVEFGSCPHLNGVGAT